MDNRESVLLPTGDYLRQILGQSKVKKNEVKSLLRSRGVFCGTDEKETTVPVLIKTGLSPSEYIEIRETYRTNEESQKYKSRSISWKSQDDISDALPDNVDYEAMLNDQFGIYQLTVPPSLTAIDGNPNHIKADFEITRKDPISNWGSNSTTHKGSVEFKKDDESNNITISMVHTAKETKEFGSKITDYLVNHFKDNEYIDKDENIVSINFLDFTNEGRVQFLNDLTQNVNKSIVRFIDTRDIHFSPDSMIENQPDNIDWMKDKIEDLKIKGKDLHSTFFVTDKSIHKFIKIYSLSCDYHFKNNELDGDCRILFDFSDNDAGSGASELTLNITSIKTKTNDQGYSRSRVKRIILDSLESIKMSLYKNYKK